MLSRVHQKTASQSPIENVDSSEANIFVCRRAVSGIGRNWRRKARGGSWRIKSRRVSWKLLYPWYCKWDDEWRWREKNLNIFSGASFFDIPVSDHFRVEIIRRGSASFLNMYGPFSVAAKQGLKANEDGRQLTKSGFTRCQMTRKCCDHGWFTHSQPEIIVFLLPTLCR